MDPKRITEYIKGELANDALTMALRLMGEDDATMSPECQEVIERWRGECLKVLKEAAE